MLTLMSVALAGSASAQNIRTTVDGNLVQFPDMKPMMTNGRVMVPVRGVFEHMNANVTWDNNTQAVTAMHNGTTIVLPVNARYATINDRQVEMDAPAVVHMGRTMVPLRFLSEALGANVEWVASSRTVEIDTSAVNNSGNTYSMMKMDVGTVIPFKLNTKLTSNEAAVGDKFEATVDTSSNYEGLPAGSILEGHVEIVKAKSGDTPGVLGLAFDRVRVQNGQTFPIRGALIGLDNKSVSNENGRLVANPGAKSNDLKYVGYGAGGGALVALLTKGNVVTTTLIGGALGYLFGEIQKDPKKANDVSLNEGSKFGVRLTRQLSFRVIN